MVKKMGPLLIMGAALFLVLPILFPRLLAFPHHAQVSAILASNGGDVDRLFAKAN